ncbi:MAG: AtpZ/AtpI family protein [Acidobacteriia bacterium]|nr:AtpZ/AtpI family protein [Terriglobia bacterium]
MAPSDPGSGKTPGDFARQFALAMEYPFLLAGSVVAGGFFGYLMDRWLHTKPFLMLLLGAAGFAVGLRDMLRRMAKDEAGSTSNQRR